MDIKNGLKYVFFAFLLFVIQLAFYTLMAPELTFSLVEELDGSSDRLHKLIALTPVLVFIEEIGLRAAPFLVFMGLLQGFPVFSDLLHPSHNPGEKKLEVLLIPLFAVVNGILHLSNVVTASPLNMLKYLLTHVFGGGYLGTIYLRYGFIQVYITHLLYNIMVYGLLLIPETFW